MFSHRPSVDPQRFTDWMYMAKTVFGEARGESDETREAIAWVIRNRAEDARHRFGGSIPEVCTAPWQFSPWNPGDPNRERMLNPVGHPTEVQAWYRCVEISQRVLDAPSWENPMPGVMWFHDTSIQPPHWAHQLERFPMAGVRKFIFYRER